MTASNEELDKNIGFSNVDNDFDRMLDEAQVIKTNESDTAVATPNEIDSVIKHIMNARKIQATQINYNRTIATTAHLVQIGATSPKFAATRVISDYGLEISAGNLREACKATNITVRKFARGIRSQVIKVAKKFGIDGNLSKNYKLENPDFDKQDLIWVSDFQTFNQDSAMPEKVSKWLLENYRTRFRTPTK